MCIFSVTQISLSGAHLQKWKGTENSAGANCHSLSVTLAIGLRSVHLYFVPHIFISMAF